jgi:hypothetical protein
LEYEKTKFNNFNVKGVKKMSGSDWKNKGAYTHYILIEVYKVKPEKETKQKFVLKEEK